MFRGSISKRIDVLWYLKKNRIADFLVSVQYMIKQTQAIELDFIKRTHIMLRDIYQVFSKDIY